MTGKGNLRSQISDLRPLVLFPLLFGVSSLDNLVESPFKLLCLLPTLELSPRLLRQMTLAFDVRILQMIRPCADLPRARLGLGFQI
jgi:hypothetical protein